MNKAVFLDRDGTINKEVHYLTDKKELELLPKVAEAIKMVNEAEFKVIIVTNQSAVARSLLTEKRLDEINDKLLKLINDEGAKIDAIYYCPHHPDENCGCRKPKPGLILKAAKEHDICLRESYMIGDMLIDVEAGINAGCKTILVLTGYGKKERKKINSVNHPDFISRDLHSAVEKYILQ